MKKITTWLRSKWLYLLPILPIIIYAISIWNTNYDIGGDTSVPLNPLNNIEKSFYLWELINQGANTWRHMYLLWQLPFYILSSVGLPPYASIKIYMVSIMVIGLIFSYLFYMAFFKNTKFENKKLGVLFSFLFVLSAGSVDILPTTIFLSALPLCAYLLIKYLDTSKIRYIIFFSIAVNYSYFAHLPQAKYLFVLLGELFFVLLLYMQIRKFSLKNVTVKLIVFSIFALLLNAFTLVPFSYEAFRSGGTYSYYTQNVTILNGDAELDTANLPFVTRFFTSSLMSGDGSLARFLSSPLFSLWTFLLWVLAFLSIFLAKSKKEKTIIYLCILGFVSFMFLAKGPNPPFGEIYKFLLFNVPVFKVFRTTSMSVIGATIFFGILVTMSMYYLRKKSQKVLLILLIIHIIVFAPIYFGVRLVTYEDKKQIKKGFTIPNEYYQMGSKLDNIKEDVKILSLPLDDSYTYKDWPYIGQSIMGWITKKPYIHGQVAGYPGFVDNLILQRMSTKEACFWTAINNIGYVLKEKDSRITDYSLSKFTFSGATVIDNTYFTLEKVKSDCVLPHIYAASGAFLFEGNKNSIPGASNFIPHKQDIVVGLDFSANQSRDLHGIAQRIIEARPEEVSELSDNPVAQKLFSDLTHLGSLDFWTYSFSIPENGTYEMVVINDGAIHKESKTFKKGNNSVKIPVSRSENLINQEQLNLFINDKATSFSQVINDWQGDDIYLLSLKYKANTASKYMVTLDQRERHFNGRLPYNEYNASLLSQEIVHQDPGVYQHLVIFRTYKNAQSATVNLQKILGDGSVETFAIEKVLLPKVFFAVLEDEKIEIPKIAFQKLNPTKYIVNVQDATAPYHLVFSESFSQNWKVYIKEPCQTYCSILNEWHYQSLPDEQHFMVNGFANGWTVIPTDSRKRADYTLVVEYFPQQLFYVGGIITFSTLLIMLIYIIVKKSL